MKNIASIIFNVVCIIGTGFWFYFEKGWEPVIIFIGFVSNLAIAFIPEKREPGDVLKHRMRLKNEFIKNATWYDYSKSYGRCIVRHVQRMDKYPEIDEKDTGVSPWFRVDIKGLYHRGIELFLRLDKAVYMEEQDAWRLTVSEEPGTHTIAVIGKIPFDFIKEIDWEGDEYYNEPHIYCEFDKKRNEPYEEVVISVQRKHGADVIYIEACSYEQAKKNRDEYQKSYQRVIT